MYTPWTQIAWKGRYRRLMCISPTEVATLDPADFTITNRYSILPNEDPDIDGIQLGQAGPPGTDEGEIIISARGDKKVALLINSHNRL